MRTPGPPSAGSPMYHHRDLRSLERSLESVWSPQPGGERAGRRDTGCERRPTMTPAAKCPKKTKAWLSCSPTPTCGWG